VTGYLARLKAKIEPPANNELLSVLSVPEVGTFEGQKSPTEQTDKTDKSHAAVLSADLVAAVKAVWKDPNFFYRFEGIAHPGREREIGHDELTGLLARLAKHGIRLSVEEDQLCWWADVPRLPPLPLIDELEAARAAIVEALQAAAAALLVS
jgi:hypothetical protein